MASDTKQSQQDIVRELLNLSHELGREDRKMALFGEGNTSARLTPARMLVKASGAGLSKLTPEELVECNTGPLLELLEKTDASDRDVEAALLESRVNQQDKKPSVEALFHAYLLTLPDVAFVGHTHAIAVNQLLCSPRALDFAERRLFPDEVVYCGIASVLVPYTDPGFHLAREIRVRTLAFLQHRNVLPRVILMENHGIITIGRTSSAVLAAMLMAEKAATIWAGAAALGEPRFLTNEQVERIASRSDEHHRQKAMNL